MQSSKNHLAICWLPFCSVFSWDLLSCLMHLFLYIPFSHRFCHFFEPLLRQISGTNESYKTVFVPIGYHCHGLDQNIKFQVKPYFWFFNELVIFVILYVQYWKPWLTSVSLLFFTTWPIIGNWWLILFLITCFHTKNVFVTLRNF